MKKFVIGERMRIALLASSALLLAVSCFFLYRNARPKTVTEEERLYTYTISANMGYSVRLTANDLFPEGSLPENRLYPARLTDAFICSVSAEYAATAPAAISGHYTTEVVVQGYQTISNQRQVVYEKRFPVGSGEIAEDEASSLKLTGDVEADFAAYKAVADNAMSLIGSSVRNEMQVVFSGSFSAETQHGSVTVPFSQALAIPLSGDIFSITRQAAFSKGDSIKRAYQSTVPPSASAWLPYVLMAALAASGLAALLKLSRPPLPAEYQLRAFRGIVKKHGSRMIKLQELPPKPWGRKVILADIDSLVKLSDDMQKPICYALEENGLPSEDMLFLQDGDVRYIFIMEIWRPEPLTQAALSGEAGTAPEANTTLVP